VGGRLQGEHCLRHSSFLLDGRVGDAPRQLDRFEFAILTLDFHDGVASVALDLARVVIIRVVQLHFVSAGKTVNLHSLLYCISNLLVEFITKVSSLLCVSDSLAPEPPVESILFINISTASCFCAKLSTRQSARFSVVYSQFYILRH